MPKLRLIRSGVTRVEEPQLLNPCVGRRIRPNVPLPRRILEELMSGGGGVGQRGSVGGRMAVDECPCGSNSSDPEVSRVVRGTGTPIAQMREELLSPRVRAVL